MAPTTAPGGWAIVLVCFGLIWPNLDDAGKALLQSAFPGTHCCRTFGLSKDIVVKDKIFG
jgi:hypothetical protein